MSYIGKVGPGFLGGHKYQLFVFNELYRESRTWIPRTSIPLVSSRLSHYRLKLFAFVPPPFFRPSHATVIYLL